MALFLILFSLFALGFAQKAPYKRVDVQGPVATQAEIAACTAQGGKIQRSGMLGWERCVQVYPDANQPCADGKDCYGQCVVDQFVEAGQKTMGKCQQTDSPFGCFQQVRNGVAEAALCVD
eukprot:g43979.t1